METMMRTMDAVEAIGCRHRLRPDHIPDQLERLYGIRPIHRMQNGKKTNLLWDKAAVERAKEMHTIWMNDHKSPLNDVGVPMFSDSDMDGIIRQSCTRSRKPYGSSVVECVRPFMARDEVLVAIGVLTGAALVGIIWLASAI